MKRSVASRIYFLFGFVVLLQLASIGNARLTDDIRSSSQSVKVFSSTMGQDYGNSGFPTILLAKDNGKSNGGKGKIGSGDKSDKPDLRYVDWSKPSSIKNGDNGDDEEDKKDGENGKEEEETEGFDRLWDVILYG